MSVSKFVTIYFSTSYQSTNLA